MIKGRKKINTTMKNSEKKIKGHLLLKVVIPASLIILVCVTVLRITGCRSKSTDINKNNELLDSKEQASSTQSGLSGGPGNSAARKTSVTSAPFYWAWWGWEPLEHNIRLGGPSYTVDGSSWWAPKWYDRLHSEELIKKISDRGINLVVTHFYKGFGLKFENAQQQNTAKIVRYAHQNGIKVLGYCQCRSIYYETFLNEEPQAINWLQRDNDGRFRSFNVDQYYRWVPCLNSQEFRTYLKKVIHVGLEETGLDGFNFDNSFSGPCYCERCEKLFREWLTKRYPNPLELFGIGSFENVRQPPSPSSKGQIYDPLIRAWVRWRCETLGEFVQEITSYARNLKPDAILLSNPAHPTSAGEPMSRSVWPVWVGRHLDLMIAENANSPEIDGDLMVSQIRAHKEGMAVGYRAVPTTWAEGPKVNMADASTRLPQTSSVIRLQIAEAAANKGVPGSNWATRALGGSDSMRIDIPEFSDALGQYIDFVKKNESFMQSSQPVKDIAVLHTFASLAYNPQYASDQVSAAEEILIRGGFSWEVIFDDDINQLNKYPLLVLSGQTHLSDQSCIAIKSFVDKGGAVVMIGDNGLYDDEGRLLSGNRLSSLKNNSVIRVNAIGMRKVSNRSWGIFVRLPSNWKQLAETIEKVASGHLSARLHDASDVALSAYHGTRGQLIIHLVNYAAPQPTKILQLELGSGWNEHSNVRLLTPELTERKLSLRRNGDINFIDVPPFEVYSVVVVE
jgi:hypothetical protein